MNFDFVSIFLKTNTMSKQYSKSELEKKTEEYFSKNPEVKEIFCTTDGLLFFQKNRADLHAKTADKMSVFGFDNPRNSVVTTDDKEEEYSLLRESATFLVEAFQVVYDVDKLKLFLSKEKDFKNRKTVISALETRIAELENMAGEEIPENIESSKDSLNEENGNEESSSK